MANLPYSVTTKRKVEYIEPPCKPSSQTILDNKIIARGQMKVIESYLKNGCILSRLKTETTWNLTYYPYFNFTMYDYKPV